MPRSARLAVLPGFRPEPDHSGPAVPPVPGRFVPT